MAVASAYDLPYFDDCFEAAISIFSPISAEEAARVLKPDGKIIMVGPGPQHLRGLASVIYDKLVPHGGNFGVLDASPFFRLIAHDSLQRDIVVDNEHIIDLLKMTPYYWHANPEKQRLLRERTELETTLDFTVRVYAKP